MKERACELCNEDAAVYCPSDSAFLCINCDAKVHEANFLVARHIRHAVCFNSVNGNIISGAGFHSTATCPQIDDSDSLSSSSDSSACVSSTTSPAKEYSGGRNRSSSSSVNQKSQRSAKSEVKCFKAEAIFVNWCGKLGVREYDVVVRMACSVLRVCLDRGTVLPFRVFLAASMWLGLRLGAGGKFEMTWQVLKRLEEVSGVPAKVISAAESRMAHALTLRGGGKKQLHRRRLELEEGWAEC